MCIGLSLVCGYTQNGHVLATALVAYHQSQYGQQPQPFQMPASDSPSAHAVQGLDQLRDQCLVASSQRADAHHMHVRIDGLLGDLLGSLAIKYRYQDRSSTRWN